ncbi:MAG: LysE family transporter [Arhodomonas sp.]|nr:LysE family transporter [Arhodomonas sp.]
MSLTAWFSLAAVCAVGAVSPGPSLAVVVRHSVRGSRTHGVAAALAHAVGIGVYALLTTLGLAAVVTADPLVWTRLIALAGAARPWRGWVWRRCGLGAGPWRGPAGRPSAV